MMLRGIVPTVRRNRSIPDEPFRIAGNLYYDRDGYLRCIDHAEQRFRQLLADQQPPERPELAVRQ